MTKSVVIVGGYGVVGAQLAAIIRKENPDLPLIIAGRSKATALALSAALGNATGLACDVMEKDPLGGVASDLAAVIALVNDPDNNLLAAAIERGIPYLDATRWTTRLKEAVWLTANKKLRAPVVFSSAWMAGVPAIITQRAAAAFSDTESVDTSILFRLADNAGPNSVEYADQLATPFRVMQDGRWQMVKPMQDKKHVKFASGFEGAVYRFDEPAQETLALRLGAKSVASRITYDDKATTGLLAFMVRSGLWRLISGPRLKKLRHKLLYNPGDGAPHEIEIELNGTGSDGAALRQTISIVDPAGQTHLTALGVYAQLQDILAGAKVPRIYFAEGHSDPDSMVELLTRHGVQMKVSSAEDGVSDDLAASAA